MKKRCTIQLPIRTHTERNRHTGIDSDVVDAVAQIYTIQTHNMRALLCSCSLRARVGLFCILCWMCIPIVYYAVLYCVQRMLCGVGWWVPFRVSCIFRFASIKCYHIAAQNPTFIFRTAKSLCVCVCRLSCVSVSVCMVYSIRIIQFLSGWRRQWQRRIRNRLGFSECWPHSVHIKAYINLTYRCVFILWMRLQREMEWNKWVRV